jgi:hypothetical protein
MEGIPGEKQMKTEPQMKITVNVRIIPFGHAEIQIKGHEKEKERGREQVPTYSEPKTTNPQLIEITFGEENYIVPTTTGGFL